MTTRLVKYGAVTAGLLVVAVAALAAFKSMQTSFQSPTATSPVPAAACSPAPCANLHGYTLWMSNLSVNGNLVSMQIMFLNSSDSTHASPEDLQLVDSKQQASGLITTSPGCQAWDRHVFNNGAKFGPLTVCFRVSTPAPPLVLRWSPDFGLFCCRTDIKLN
ncbi:MAG TPA: hypothetical protein VGU71_03920 [Candidatus Dormibacteraeota bacterium]|nr:hypothetical protein [Candidatus Dormibacteraeota bacterium]